MLIDYIAEVKKGIAERRASEVETLIAANDHHDITRGRIHGLDRALSIIDETLKLYTDDEDELPPAVVGTAARPANYRPISLASKTRGRA